MEAEKDEVKRQPNYGNRGIIGCPLFSQTPEGNHPFFFADLWTKGRQNLFIAFKSAPITIHSCNLPAHRDCWVRCNKIGCDQIEVLDIFIYPLLDFQIAI